MNCNDCEDTGILWEEDPYLCDGIRLLHSEFCACELGQALRKEEQERVEDEPPFQKQPDDQERDR